MIVNYAESLEEAFGKLIVYKNYSNIFTKLYKPYTITPDLLENGRDISLKLGYEDDAMIVNDCLYREVIEEMIGQGKVIDIKEIGIAPVEFLEPEDVIGKKWIVLVDYNIYFIGGDEGGEREED